MAETHANNDVTPEEPAARLVTDRCPWAEASEYSRLYHDTRWCVPVHDDRELYAMLVLEGMQAGLSWDLVLRRERGIRELCDDLDPVTCARYDEARIQDLLAEPAMIRSQLKVRSIVANACALLGVREQWGSFDSYIWHFTGGRIIDHQLGSEQEMPAQDGLSREVSRDLKRRGFKFVGPVTTYSYLQGIGVVNDHLLSCPFHG